MRKLFATSLALVALVAAGCSGDDHKGNAPTEYNNDPKVLHIVMGSEQHLVFDQIVRPWCEKKGSLATHKNSARSIRPTC
jgi:Ca-activated chloride channel family protein